MLQSYHSSRLSSVSLLFKLSQIILVQNGLNQPYFLIKINSWEKTRKNPEKKNLGTNLIIDIFISNFDHNFFSVIRGSLSKCRDLIERNHLLLFVSLKEQDRSGRVDGKLEERRVVRVGIQRFEFVNFAEKTSTVRILIILSNFGKVGYRLMIRSRGES